MRDISQWIQRMTRSNQLSIAPVVVSMINLIEQFTELKKLSKCFDENNNEVFFKF